MVVFNISSRFIVNRSKIWLIIAAYGFRTCSKLLTRRSSARLFIDNMMLNKIYGYLLLALGCYYLVLLSMQSSNIKGVWNSWATPADHWTDSYLALICIILINISVFVSCFIASYFLLKKKNYIS